MTNRTLRWAINSKSKVQWNDPDDGLCSYVGVIRSVQDVSDFVRVTFEDGHQIEGYPEEFSKKITLEA